MSFFSQTPDSLKTKELPSVTIEAFKINTSIGRLEPVSGTYIFSGKKTEVIELNQTDANITDKTGRQIFAKVPGVFVYDMDGSGNQLNISTRGLDPHRGWEFNIRKDGVLTNSDMYAYPASHYSIPLESVDRIELVRGSGALQYGAQFGGMINTVSKQGDSTRPISFESFNTIGSYNLLSSYNAVGGKIGKINYYAYVALRSRDGYRTNEHTNYDAENISLTYEPCNKFSIKLEWARSNYLYKIPGPLTDSMFEADPKQATRSRNYFSPTINIPSLTIKWDLTKSTKLQFISSAVIGTRNSVLYDKPATIKDSINPSTLQYSKRQVDIDAFNSYTQELRVLQHYHLGKIKSTLACGLQLMNNNLHRKQLGVGTTGSDYDLSLTNPVWGRDLSFKTINNAFYVENNFMLLSNLSLNVGARYEKGESKMRGTILYYAENEIPVNITHNFPLFGSSFSYKPKEALDIYGGFSQNYRPVIFKDIIPGSTFEKVDPNIKDAFGSTTELGFRGKWKFLQWDIGAFLLHYNKRFGTLAQTDTNGSFYTYRTNIGNSLTKGLELFLEAYYNLTNNSRLTVFTSTSFMDGRYTSGELKSGNTNSTLKGKQIEGVAKLITRNGMTYQVKKIRITLLYSYTAESFADALNAKTPSSTGAVGIVPSYGILDINLTYKVCHQLEIKAGINNMSNESYFTKRPLFYPGPGVWPSEGRNGTLSIIVKL